MSSLILYNRLESANSISVIGGTATTTGSPTFEACKFGNGCKSSSNSNYNTFTITAASINNALKYTIEFWGIPLWNCTNGGSADGAYHNAVGLLSDSGKFVDFYYYQSDAFYYDAGTFFWRNADSGQTWTSGDVVHYAYVVDSSGIAGSSDKARCYINGALAGASTTIALTSIGGTNVTLYVTNSRGAGTWKGTVDNIKVYNYAKTDFSDRFNERGGMNDQVVIV